MIITVNADMFRIVAGFVSSEETRYYLKGVFIEPHPVEGVIMVATDGHRLMTAHDITGKIDIDVTERLPIVALNKSLLSLCKGERRETGSRTLIIEASGATDSGFYASHKATIETAEGVTVGTAPNVLIDGTFPDWRRVVPNPSKPAPAVFNGDYLTDFAKASKEWAKVEGKRQGRLMVFGDDGCAAIVRFDGVEAMFGVLMPMRGASVAEVPGWYKATPVPRGWDTVEGGVSNAA